VRLTVFKSHYAFQKTISSFHLAMTVLFSSRAEVSKAQKIDFRTEARLLDENNCIAPARIVANICTFNSTARKVLEI